MKFLFIEEGFLEIDQEEVCTDCRGFLFTKGLFEEDCFGQRLFEKGMGSTRENNSPGWLFKNVERPVCFVWDCFGGHLLLVLARCQVILLSTLEARRLIAATWFVDLFYWCWEKTAWEKLVDSATGSVCKELLPQVCQSVKFEDQGLGEMRGFRWLVSKQAKSSEFGFFSLMRYVVCLCMCGC